MARLVPLGYAEGGEEGPVVCLAEDVEGRGGAGRAGYVPSEQLEGVMDPGALAVSVWLRAALIDPAAGA